MKKYRNEAQEFFNNLSDEEFTELLEEAGFEFEDGIGGVVFTNQKIYEGVVDEHFDDNGNLFYAIRGKAIDDEFNADDFDFILSKFKSKKVRVVIEVID